MESKRVKCVCGQLRKCIINVGGCITSVCMARVHCLSVLLVLECIFNTQCHVPRLWTLYMNFGQVVTCEDCVALTIIHLAMYKPLLSNMVFLDSVEQDLMSAFTAIVVLSENDCTDIVCLYAAVHVSHLYPDPQDKARWKTIIKKINNKCRNTKNRNKSTRGQLNYCNTL